MAVKIRLQRHGRKKAPYYYIVVADARAPRDGKFIEKLGVYDPTTIPATIEVDNGKALEWMGKGAQPTNTVRAILSYKGVLYKKHLDRGVKKGALTAEDADKMYQEWLSSKESQVNARITDLGKKKEADKQARLAEESKKREEKAAAIAAAAAAAEGAAGGEEAAAEATEDATATAEAPAAEAPATEAAPAEEVKEEAPAEEAKAEEGGEEASETKEA